jgi:hypothetical protein
LRGTFTSSLTIQPLPKNGSITSNSISMRLSNFQARHKPLPFYKPKINSGG